MRDQKKILFLNPPLSQSLRYGLLSTAGATEPPLGLAYLAAVARQAGFDARILDAQALGIDIEESVRLILEGQPDLLAITLSSMSMDISARLALMVKEKASAIKIIVGGSHCTALPEETLRDNPCFDVGIIGEGERTLEKLLSLEVNGGALATVNGIVFRVDHNIHRTAPSERIDALDELPTPAFDLLPVLGQHYRPAAQSIKYLPAVSLVTSRGCSGRCLFCDRKTFGNKVRMHGAAYVAEMMERLYKDFGVRGILFEDDNFMLSEERLAELSREIKKRKLRMAWAALSRVDTINENKIKIAKDCGCWQLLFGIESGAQKILDFYQKGITLEQIRNAIGLTKKHGLHVKGFLMVGNPLETRDTLEATHALAMGLPLDDISITYFTPYPGADIWDRVDDHGYFSKKLSDLTCFEPVFIPHGLTREALVDFQARLYKDFYSRWDVRLSYVTRLRSVPQVVALYQSYRLLQAQLTEPCRD